jgi:hypothetical protein
VGRSPANGSSFCNTRQHGTCTCTEPTLNARDSHCVYHFLSTGCPCQLAIKLSATFARVLQTSGVHAVNPITLASLPCNQLKCQRYCCRIILHSSRAMSPCNNNIQTIQNRLVPTGFCSQVASFSCTTHSYKSNANCALTQNFAQHNPQNIGRRMRAVCKDLCRTPHSQIL